MTSDNETVERPSRKDSRTYLSMLARAAPVRNAWRLGGFMVMRLVIGCQCPTTPLVAAEGLQSLARALDMGARRGAAAQAKARRCAFVARGRTTMQQAYDVCLAAAPDSVCGCGRSCATLPAAMLGRTSGWGAKWAGPLHLFVHDKSERLTIPYKIFT
jgi:hypothetical protein